MLSDRLTQRPYRGLARPCRVAGLWLGAAALLVMLGGCGGDRNEATRTPVPTFTPTPLGQGAPAQTGASGPAVVAEGATTTATLPPLPPTAPVPPAPPAPHPGPHGDANPPADCHADPYASIVAPAAAAPAGDADAVV